MLLRALVTDHRNLQPKLYIPSIIKTCTFLGGIFQEANTKLGFLYISSTKKLINIFHIGCNQESNPD